MKIIQPGQTVFKLGRRKFCCQLFKPFKDNRLTHFEFSECLSCSHILYIAAFDKLFLKKQAVLHSEKFKKVVYVVTLFELVLTNFVSGKKQQNFGFGTFRSFVKKYQFYTSKQIHCIVHKYSFHIHKSNTIFLQL